jgi:glycosyltransferase involved in cell wall biosynthesis
MSEQEGSILALLLKLSRSRTPLMMVGVVPTSRPMWIMLRILHIHTHITRLFPTNSFSLDTLQSSWGVPEETLALLPYQVDVEFFSDKWADPQKTDIPYILGVGRESRDYETLIAAVRDLPINLVIAADSLWAQRQQESWRADLPPNVSVTVQNYAGLRDLYAGSAFVVVPLFETDVQNGITAIQEAMSMGKAVIVTRTRGQGDLVADDHVVQIDGRGRSTAGYFARYFAPDSPDLHGPTGIYVRPGDVAGMRTAIERLCGDEQLAHELGRRGRAVCESIVSLDCFVSRVLAATKPYC